MSAVKRSSEQRLAHWRAAWPKALAHWSKYTRLHDPLLCETKVAAAKEGLSGSFAMIKLADKSVVIDMAAAGELALDDYAVEILAHEIGHHVLAPSTALDHFRLLARIRAGLPTLEGHAGMIANLYTDLLINDRLQRQEGLRMDGVYAKIHAAHAANPEKNDAPANGLWTLYTGIYEELWGLERGSIGGPVKGDHIIGDVWLGARLVRVYAQDWLTGGSRFAALVLPYLVAGDGAGAMTALLQDTAMAGEGSEPGAISNIDPGEQGDNIHPSKDSQITGEAPDDGTGAQTDDGDNSMDPGGKGRQKGQRREPFEYGEILRAAGVTLSDSEIAMRYYREQALPHLVSFPKRVQSRLAEPQIEGMEQWDLGDPLEYIDWLGSLIQAPQPIPGVTTMRRTYGEEAGSDQQVQPVDLDLYVDSSGSMPNPKRQISYLTLAGTIIALSALKSGARVQATLWSGKKQFMSTDGFVTREQDVLNILTGFYGGATAFPIHKLRDTYADRDAHSRVAHILMISDDGISTMFDEDEQGRSGWDISARALACAGGGGTMALNLWSLDEQPWKTRAEQEQGWHIERVSDFAELVTFARSFSQRHYARSGTGQAAGASMKTGGGAAA